MSVAGVFGRVPVVSVLEIFAGLVSDIFIVCWMLVRGMVSGLLLCPWRFLNCPVLRLSCRKFAKVAVRCGFVCVLRQAWCVVALFSFLGLGCGYAGLIFFSE